MIQQRTGCQCLLPGTQEEGKEREDLLRDESEEERKKLRMRVILINEGQSEKGCVDGVVSALMVKNERKTEREKKTEKGRSRRLLTGVCPISGKL